jgi:hypothetical protein
MARTGYHHGFDALQRRRSRTDRGAKTDSVIAQMHVRCASGACRSMGTLKCKVFCASRLTGPPQCERRRPRRGRTFFRGAEVELPWASKDWPSRLTTINERRPLPPTSFLMCGRLQARSAPRCCDQAALHRPSFFCGCLRQSTKSAQIQVKVRHCRPGQKAPRCWDEHCLRLGR